MNAILYRECAWNQMRVQSLCKKKKPLFNFKIFIFKGWYIKARNAVCIMGTTPTFHEPPPTTPVETSITTSKSNCGKCGCKCGIDFFKTNVEGKNPALDLILNALLNL